MLRRNNGLYQRKIAYISFYIIIQYYAENIYDEPSLPDSIYQEVTRNNNIISPQQEIQIEIMKNYSYSYVTVRS